MTPPELDAETKARIEAEEAYRAQIRAQQGQVQAKAVAPQKKGMGCGSLILGALGLFLLVGVAVQLMGGPPSSSTSAPSTSSSPQEVESPSATEAPKTPETITKGASGKTSTEPFTLQGGNYSVHATASNDCVYYLKLVKTTEQDFEGKDLASFNAAGDQSANLYNVEAGDYYIDANTGPTPECTWAVTISN